MIVKLCLFVLLIQLTGGGVLPPPWADPAVNPCASRPRGWQLIYWPPDGQCYKIFQIGYPCPETMELSVENNKRNVKAECKCPPQTALYTTDGKCYELFQNSPCKKGQYFGPEINSTQQERLNKVRYGVCKTVEPCPKSNLVFWHKDEKCYEKFTRGPCSKGQLITVDSNGLAVCHCNDSDEMRKFYWRPKRSCYEHYTRGPCQEKGHLFLPEGKCDCHSRLPHYHHETDQCYELGTIGPCKQGHHFQIQKNSKNIQATCKCKDGHIFWHKNGKCYRPYTQGPCQQSQILINSTSCVPVPCSRGHLYFSEQKTCYRIGSQGPCPMGQVVTFDFRTRPSIDGISYNGICSCTGNYKENGECLKGKRSTKPCEGGMGNYRNQCYKLYAQGPCKNGEWLVPSRQEKMRLEQSEGNSARCDCKPGYSRTLNSDNNSMQCLPPAFNLANYLNKNFVYIGNS